MTTQQIHYFLEAARCLSFTQAAQNLYTTQSTLSKNIISMENELGIKLFNRQCHSLTLTSAGILMRTELGKLEHGLKLALDQATRLDRATEGHLSCAILDIIDPTAFIFPILERFQEKYPNVELEIHICGFHEIRNRLEEKRIDVVFDKHFNLKTVANLEQIPLSQVTPSIMMPQSHPLAGLEQVSFKQLKDENWILLELDECPCHVDSLMALCLKEGFYPKIAKYASSNAAKIAYVNQGYGISLFDAEIPIPRWAKVKLVPLNSMTPSEAYAPDIFLAWRHDSSNPAVNLFTETLAEELGLQAQSYKHLCDSK